MADDQQLLDTNRAIVQKYLDNGLIDECLSYQFRYRDKTYLEDYRQDLILELLTYKKLKDADDEGHMNALLTRFIQNNIFSKTSWYYRRYIRNDERMQGLTKKELDIPDDGGYE